MKIVTPAVAMDLILNSKNERVKDFVKSMSLKFMEGIINPPNESPANLDPKLEDKVRLLEARVASLESKLRAIQANLLTNVELIRASLEAK